MSWNKRAQVLFCVLIAVAVSELRVICAQGNVLSVESTLDSNRERKIITVGDEFPSISIRLSSNRTEYEIELNTSNHKCGGEYICEAFIPLTEMYCKNLTTTNLNSTSSNQPYLEINGITGTGETVSVKWCEEYGIFAQDDFMNIKVEKAIIIPRGDWSNNTTANVIVMATFSQKETLKKRRPVLIGSLPVQLRVTNTKTEYEFKLDPTNADCQGSRSGDCSIGAHVLISCPGVSKDSAYLQLDLILKNNESISKILCLIRDGDDRGEPSNISAYLANIQSLTLKPMGNWKSLSTFARVKLNTLMSSRVDSCPVDYFDCRTECTRPAAVSPGSGSGSGPGVNAIERGEVQRSLESSPAAGVVPGLFTVVDINDTENKLSCIPWTWICGNEDEIENCPETTTPCTPALKFCPMKSIHFNGNGTSDSTTNSKSDSGGSALRQFLFYYGFFLIPFGFILIAFSGTVLFVKLRTLHRTRGERDGGSRSEPSSSSMCPIHLFGRLKRKIPYQIVENDTA